MVELVEFKVKQAGVRWEDTPAMETSLCSSAHAACVRAGELANEHRAEVRWNWAWSLQGHYVAPAWKKSRKRSQQVEFRVKRPGVPWEKTPETETAECSSFYEAFVHAEGLAAKHGVEVRWSWQESAQEEIS